MKVLCIGNAAFDVTLPLNNYPVENKKIRVDLPRVECGGGSSSNVAYLLAKWGVETYFAGVVGDDYYGEVIKKEFNDIGVNIKYLETRKGADTTTSYIINNMGNGSRTVLTHKENKLDMKKREIDDKFDVIFLDGYEYDFAKDAIKANPDAIKIIDAGSLRENTVDLCKMVDYIVCSHDFAEDYTKTKVNYKDIRTLMSIYEKLKKDFQCEIIITLEDKGCFTYHDGYKLVPSLKMKAVDSTGAGDIFHGAFTYCIINGYDLIKAMKISNITGALSVTKIGGRYSISSKEEVMKKYDEINVS